MVGGNYSPKTVIKSTCAHSQLQQPLLWIYQQLAYWTDVDETNTQVLRKRYS
jgi:hypothetical protein